MPCLAPKKRPLALRKARGRGGGGELVSLFSRLLAPGGGPKSRGDAVRKAATRHRRGDQSPSQNSQTVVALEPRMHGVEPPPRFDLPHGAHFRRFLERVSRAGKDRALPKGYGGGKGQRRPWGASPSTATSHPRLAIPRTFLQGSAALLSRERLAVQPRRRLRQSADLPAPNLRDPHHLTWRTTRSTHLGVCRWIVCHQPPCRSPPPGGAPPLWFPD